MERSKEKSFRDSVRMKEQEKVYEEHVKNVMRKIAIHRHGASLRRSGEDKDNVR